MARLIIGHVTDRTANLWVRGSDRYPVAIVTVAGADVSFRRKLTLKADDGYTGVVRATGLRPGRRYTVQVAHADGTDTAAENYVDFGHSSGSFRTFPEPDGSAEIRFIFGSCNLHSLGPVASPDVPYTRIGEEARDANAHFMLHCGDQIYYDVPIIREPTPAVYRDKYIDAWSDCRPARRLLTELPHYMILDDHEIINDFANDIDVPGPTPTAAFRDAGVKVYREWQYSHSPRNHGADALHYSFDCGPNSFFVMDTRTERYSESRTIVSDAQLDRLFAWLRRNADRNKFIVSSVPFVAESRSLGDKWSSFRRQREAIIDFVFSEGIEHLAFLCGDQHNSHYARMTLTDGKREQVIHELMSSPINQIQRSSFNIYRRDFSAISKGGVDYHVDMRRDDFYNAHSNAMLVTVRGRQVTYRIFRTRSRRAGPAPGRFSFSD